MLCPSEDVVVALFEGRLSGTLAADVRRHVDVCSMCLAALGALSSRSRPAARRDGADWSPPDELDGFRIIAPLGRGGMGRVFLAHEIALDRRVALKFIATEQPDETAMSRFLIE